MAAGGSHLQDRAQVTDRPAPAPEMVGHSGAAAYAPENSRAAFRKALELGVDRVECDVRRSVDGALVLVHHERVVGPDGRVHRVDRLTVPDLRRLLHSRAAPAAGQAGA